jgi:hypothetical protein
MTRALPESRNSDLPPYRSQPSRRSFVEDLRQTFGHLWRGGEFQGFAGGINVYAYTGDSPTKLD